MKKILIISLICIIACALAFSLSSCNKHEDGEDDNPVITTPDERREAVDAFENAFIALGGEGWKRDLSDAELAALNDVSAYYVLRETTLAVGARLYADTDFQISKISYYTELLQKEETVTFARDVVNRENTLDLLSILGNYELSSDDFSSLCFILFETGLYDLTAVIDKASSSMESYISAHSEYQGYRFLGTRALTLSVYAEYDETELADVSKDELRAILLEIKSVDSSYGGALEPSAAVSHAEIVMLSDKIESLKNGLYQSAVQDNAEFSALKTYVATLEAALSDYQAEYGKDSDKRDASVMKILGDDLKAACGSSLEPVEDSSSWYAALEAEAKSVIRQKKLSVPVYRFVDVAESVASLANTKKEYKKLTDSSDFETSAKALVEEKESLGALLSFAYKTSRMVDSVFGENGVDGETILDLEKNTSAEVVTVVKSFALAAKELNEAYSDEEITKLAKALSDCSQPLSLLAQTKSVISVLDDYFNYSSSGFVNYSTMVTLVADNFELLPTVLELSYSSAYFGFDEFSVNILRAVSKEEIDPAFLSVVYAKMMSAVVSPGEGEVGVAKSKLLSKISSYKTKIAALSASEKNEKLSGDIEFWTTLSTATNLLLSSEGDNYIWRMSEETYNAINDAYTLKYNIGTMKTEYAKGGLPSSNSALYKAVAKLETMTGVDVSDSFTSAEYSQLLSAAEALLVTKNNAWFSLLVSGSDGVDSELEVIVGRVYYTTTAANLSAVISAYTSVADMKSATTAQINEFKVLARTAGVGGKN